MRLLLVLFFLAVTEISFGQSWDTIPRLPEHYRKRLEQFRKEKERPGAILFLGNSITEGGNWQKLLGDTTALNRGIGGDITFGLLQRLDEVVRHQPRKLFLLIGINDLSKGIPEEVVLQNTFVIVSKLRRELPNTRIYVQSILPVNPSFKNFPAGYALQQQVEVVNTQLKKIQARFGYTYIDLFSRFLDKQGVLEATLSTDGLHLNAAGYQRWVEVLKEENCL